jgi:N-acyl-D-aspartate/D-glutamate deacylase
VRIVITWSNPHPEIAGRTLQQIALAWGVGQKEAAERVQPAEGIACVWVDGLLSYKDGASTGQRAGRFLPRPIHIALPH